jgi:hypothetical protein
MEAFYEKIVRASNPKLDHFADPVRVALKRIDRDAVESLKMLKASRIPTNEYRDLSAIFDLLMYRNCVGLAQARICQIYFETCDLELRAQTLTRLLEKMRLPITLSPRRSEVCSMRDDANA